MLEVVVDQGFLRILVSPSIDHVETLKNVRLVCIYIFQEVKGLPHEVADANYLHTGIDFGPFDSWTLSGIECISYVLRIVPRKYAEAVSDRTELRPSLLFLWRGLNLNRLDDIFFALCLLGLRCVLFPLVIDCIIFLL